MKQLKYSSFQIIFSQQDNHPKETKKFFRKERCFFAQSLDLNFNGHLWNCLDRQISCLERGSKQSQF